MKKTPKLRLANFTFQELFHSQGLNRLDQTFLAELKIINEKSYHDLMNYRSQKNPISPLQTSELLLTIAPVLEIFLAKLFNIEKEAAIAQAKTTSHNPLSLFKKYFVLKRAKKELSRIESFPAFAELENWLKSELKQSSLQTNDKELAVALLGQNYLSNPEKFSEEIEKLVQWCTHVLATSEPTLIKWTCFSIPERLDYNNLVPTIPVPEDSCGRVTYPESKFFLRDGFKLTDPRMSPREIQDQVNYCIYCHDHDGDFCSKGFPVKKGDPSQGLKKNPLDVIMTGCPLEEKISEMNILKRDGYTLASLAMVMVDNPMCPATGHRICNDCMKACIYQKQEPVNIPQIETGILTDVLTLPWGVEIYDLLTRWNPLRQKQWVMNAYNGLKILIAGMGPAGFTLAHHLLMEGFAVTGFDGLKIEPLPELLIHAPIYCFDDLKESLDQRLIAGFGGVAEYGITVRWDKNFLKLIYLSLMRRPYFQVFGSVRFGGTITVDDAWDMGFHHFVVAVGAGLPKALSIPGSLAPGMRQANDFLMALQLGNAAKASSLTNLQIRLPAVVIGGGLTGVDTATEIQAYYIKQVEKIRWRYEILIKEYGFDAIHQQLNASMREILTEYLQHAELVQKERDRAKASNQLPNFIKLIREWGGVTIIYRRSMQESPAYINNHEELQKALAEGIYYAEKLEPVSVDLNEHGHVETLICHKRLMKEANVWVTTSETVRLPARSILVATGTQPNTAYEFEHRGTFSRINLQYQHYEEKQGELNAAHGIAHCKEPEFGPFTSYHKQDYRVSLIGDTHPVFHGSVVKAIASGMRTYPKIQTCLKAAGKLGDEFEYRSFSSRITHLFQAHVIAISRQAENVIELVIHAPLAAKHYHPGQFYRLQNYETFSPHLDHTLLQMEPLALAPTACDHANGNLHFMIIEQNASAKLSATLKGGDPVSLMGPTGARTKIPHGGETILIIGHAASLPFLLNYGQKARLAGNRVIYIGHFASQKEIFCQSKIEEAADVIIWVSETDECVTPNRDTDYVLKQGEVMKALEVYASLLSLADVDRIFIAGNTDLLRRFQMQQKDLFKKYFLKGPKISAAVYGNMQCMLKGVCAQCLQWQIDPETGLRTKAVFACSWQDQPLEIIDIDHMDARQFQNQLHDKITQLWVDHLFKQYEIERV